LRRPHEDLPVLRHLNEDSLDAERLPIDPLPSLPLDIGRRDALGGLIHEYYLAA